MRSAVLMVVLVLVSAGFNSGLGDESTMGPVFLIGSAGIGEDGCYSDPPVYYAIKLVSTRRLPGTRMASGVANVTFAASPYGVNVSPEGTYVYDLAINIENLKPPAEGVYVTWLTLPNLSDVVRLGALDETNSIKGTVDWNKFLVVVSLEESDDPDQVRWNGPIAFRGLSRSGLMHTLAGHGPFNSEPCTSYGYE